MNRFRPGYASTARAVLGVALLVHASPSRAESISEVGHDVGGAIRFLIDLFAELGNKARDETFSFLRTVELYDLERELDRLVGNPWELSDSTSYKLSLFPLRMAYPVYQQLVTQMTRLDELRSMRIQNLTPDSMRIIDVRLDILDEQRSSRQLLDSITHYLNAREIMDLGVYGLAQTPAFPEDETGWQRRKHQIARHKGIVALTALTAGALFDAGAYARSGRLKSWGDSRYQLRWYGSFQRLGFGAHPLLRGGLTLHLPGLELAGGWFEQVRPDSTQMESALEFSARESWLSRWTGPTGWDSFLQAALRRVVESGVAYEGERMTGRAGIFSRRQKPLFHSQVVLRTSLEGESDFDQSMRFAASVGLDHTRSGISFVVQSSRNLVIQQGWRGHDIRTALFLAGTMEPPTHHYIKTMIARARLVREQWEIWRGLEQERQAVEARVRLAPGFPSASTALSRLGPITLAVEDAQLRLIDGLADYLEARRRAYALEHWPRSPRDDHGPLDEVILYQIRDLLLRRLRDLADFLQRSPSRLQAMAERPIRLREELDHLPIAAERQRVSLAAELEKADREWRQESDEVARAFQLYAKYHASVQRIVEAAPRLADLSARDRLSPGLQRRLILLCAQRLEE